MNDKPSLPLRTGRVGHGLLAVRHGTPDALESDARTAIIDTLANIFHYAEQAEVDVDEALESARMHFNAERGDGED